MKRKFYILISLLCSGALSYGQVPGRIFGTVQVHPGGILRLHTNPVNFGAHINTPRDLPQTSSVYFTDGGFADQVSDAGCINGYVTKLGAGDFRFPVGNQEGSDYRWLEIKKADQTTIALSVAYWNGNAGKELDPTGGPHDLASISAAGTKGVDKIVLISDVGFWDWIPVDASSKDTPMEITVSIPNHQGISGFGASSIRLVGWNSDNNQWENLSGSVAPVANIEGTQVTGVVKSMFPYSAIAIGSVDDSPLPVQLVSFSAAREASQVNLNWRTTEEVNADYFEIERSLDTKNWKVIGKESAAGESKAALDYFFKDRSPLTGKNYYRLKMVDKDETFTYSRVLHVGFDGLMNKLAMYPNPVSSVLYMKDAEPEKMEQVSIYDVTGKEVYQSKSMTADGIKVDHFINGMYFVKVRMTDGSSTNQKILIHH